MDEATSFTGDAQLQPFTKRPQYSKTNTGLNAHTRSLLKAGKHRFPTRHLWDLYHAKRAEHHEYGENLTQLNEEPISTLPSFMEHYNNTPLEGLKFREAFHFTKYTVKPLWEDPRNQAGGAWHFRIKDTGRAIPGKQKEEPKEVGQKGELKNEEHGEEWKHKEKVEGMKDVKLEENPHGTNQEETKLMQQQKKLDEQSLFEKVVFMAVNDNFAEVMESEKDDLCVVSYVKGLTSSSILIWNRRADSEKSVQAIKDLVLSFASDADRAWLQMGHNCSYKKHRDHKDFNAEEADQLSSKSAQDDSPLKRSKILQPDGTFSVLSGANP
ncbi:MAG: hypothetical protein OHK93_008592 [Ramalina farinacea]|uniref:Uncharacterized protein n=1 Tax=Ramalina farinacea TaxID=258253 RepID=A0AA43TVE8_9LECA|nr:hypothetical protein [Ramalina farinacea]